MKLSFVGGPCGGTTVELDLPERLRSATLPRPMYVVLPGYCSIVDALELNHVTIYESPPKGLSQRDEPEPDSLTLEFPFGMTFAEALEHRQVRLISEKASRVPRSVYPRIARYRNVAGDKWHFVDYT